MEVKVDTLIIGAGITGLSLGSFLKDKDFLILEKDTSVGGYCKTTIRNGFVWDYSGHFFHFKNQYIKDYVFENLKSPVITVQKKTKIHYNGSLVDFPFQYNIDQLPLQEFIECLYDYYNKPNSFATFKEYVISLLGKGICKKFIIPYNEKLYACDLNTLEYDCMGRFFPKELSFTSLLDKLNLKYQVESYNDNFIYPLQGSFSFVRSLLDRIDTRKIKTSTNILKIDLDSKLVITDGVVYKFNKLISTVPFNTLLKLTGKEVNLSYNKTVVLNLGFDLDSEINCHWIYFPGKEIFYRVGFYSNILSQKNLSLYVEISKNSTEDIDQQELLKQVLQDLKKVSIIDKHNLVDHQMIVMNPAYVHITKESKNLYGTWSRFYNKEDIYSIGRYGAWTYCSIEDNIIQAQELSKTLY